MLSAWAMVVDANGQKMSKHLGNVIDPWTVLDKSGADAFRWYFYTCAPPGCREALCAQHGDGRGKKFTLTLWNIYSFFVTYANLDELDNLSVSTSTSIARRAKEAKGDDWTAGCFLL